MIGYKDWFDEKEILKSIFGSNAKNVNNADAYGEYYQTKCLCINITRLTL